MNDQTQSNSTIYKWHSGRKKFKIFQTIPTWTARDFEYFNIDGGHFLVVANHAKGKKKGDNSITHSESKNIDTAERGAKKSKVYDRYYERGEVYFPSGLTPLLAICPLHCVAQIY